MKKRILALLLAMVMIFGMIPVSAFATEAEEPEVILCETEGCEYVAGHEGNCSNYVAPTEACATEGCTYGANHEGKCSNFVACETAGCEFAADHDGNCSNYVAPTETCATEGCTYGVNHEGNCSNFVACETEGCEYAAGHDGNCSNYVAPTEACATEGCIYGANHEGKCSNFVACETEGCEYAAGHEGNCSNYVVPTEAIATVNTKSNYSVTVGFTVVDCLDHNVERMRKELTVTPGLAQEYFPDGQYGGSIGMTTEVGENDVTPIDVLVAAHLDAYGDAFAENPGDYIEGFDYAIKMFGESSEITWTANGLMPYAESEYGNMGYAINQYVVQNGDEICFYRMSFYSTSANVYASFDRVQATVNTGEELTLRLGYCATMEYYNTTFAAANTEIFYLNEDGTLGSSTGLTTDENGNVTVSFAEAGTYYLTCKGEVEYADMMGNSTSALSPACVKVTVKEAAVAVESVTLDKSELTLEIGGTENLTATVNPDNATDKTVAWESSDSTVATVENGVVTAVAAGEATITAKAGNKEAICTVTVNAPAPNPNVIDATIGGTRTSPSNIAYIDKITIGDTVSVNESSFDGLTANIVLAPGTAPDATFDFTFSYVHTMPQMTDMFDIAFDSSSDVNEDGTGTVTLEDGSATAIVTVIATMPFGTQNMNWTLNFTTALDTTNNVIDATIGGTRTSPSNIAYIDKITIGDTVSVKESSFDGLTANIVLAPGTAPDATFDFAFSYVHTMPQMTNMFAIAFDDTSDVDENGSGTVTLEDGSATAVVTVIATMPFGTQNMNWTLNFTTALDTTNNVIDATIGGTRTSPSNVAYIDKITIGDAVSVKESSFDGLTANIVLAPGTAPDAAFDFAFSYVHTMPNNTMFAIAFDDTSDVDENGSGTVTLEDGSATAIVTVIATMPFGTQNMNWTLNFTTASGGSSGGGNKNAIPVEAKGLLYGDLYIGIQQFLFRDCKVLDYNWADEYTLNVYVSDATADDGTLSIMYNTLFDSGTDIDIPSPYTVQMESGKAIVQYHITPKGAYNTTQNAHAAHTITVNITNKGLTLPALADGVAAEVDASAKVGEAFALNLNEIFRDAESDPMTYCVNIDGEGAVDADAQYSFTAPTVGEYKLVFKAHDGMNWSEATYTVYLKVTSDKAPFTFTVKVPDAVTPTFSVTKGFREDGTDWAGTPLTATKGESKDGWTAYAVEVPGDVTWVSVRGTDGTDDWGGMAFEVEENAVITLRQVNAVINSKIVLDNVESYPTADQAVFKVEYADDVSSRYAVSGSTFTDDYGYPGYRFLLVAADNSLVYTYYAEPLGEVAKHYSTNMGASKTITTDSASVVTATLPLGTKSAFAITAPAEAKVQMFTQSGGNYYGATEIPAFDTKDNGDGTKTVTFNGTGTGTATYRVSMEGKITKAGYVSGEGVTVTWDANDPGPDYRRAYDFDESGYYKRADDSMLVNVNYRNNLLLDVGETHTLRSYRIWQIINNDTMNVMIEPDFHINVLSGSDVISLSEYPDYHGNGTGNRMNITALKTGTAIIEVTYDAIAIMERTAGDGEINGMGGLTFNACDPTRTALIVVQVGDATTDVDFGIRNNGGNVWDAEHDTLYFFGDKGQISFKPTVSSGSISEVAISADKGTSWTVLDGSNGTYTADIVPGNNIIRITKADGAVAYQLLRGDKITYTVAERSGTSDLGTADGDGIIEPGEAIIIYIHGGHVPYGKMAGIYNPWNFLTKYTFNGELTKGGTGLYTYAYENLVFLTVPDDAQPGDELTITKGHTVPGTGFGGGGGSHRDAGDVVPPNLDADDSISGGFNIFPDLTITVGQDVEVEEKVPVESVTLDKTTAELEAGKTVKLTATVKPSNATEKDVTWTSSNENVATVENGVVTAVAEGSATITVTTKDGGKVATCVVTVKKAAEDNDPEFGIPTDEIVGYVTVSFEDFGIRVEGEDIDPAYASPRGVIIPATKVPFKAYDTIASVTLRLLKAKGYTASYTGNEFGGFYLSAINGFGEFDAGSGSGWMITWNGWFINKGASEFAVKDGDVVKWQYTCQLGADIGDDSFYGSVTEVIKLINAIGTVTEDSGDKIKAARAAYDKLSDTDKKRVSNYKKLTDAEVAYEALMNESVENVKKLIDAIGTVTLNSKSKIEAARKAYDALPTAQKLKVSNYSKLTDAESKLAELQKEEDKKAAQKVVDMIDDLDSNSETFEKDVEAAKKAYDALTADQKKLVTNYSKLTDALKELASQEDKEAAEAVEKLIDAIGTVTKDSEDKIKAAREAYDKLTDEQKALVENIAVLEAAEEKLAKLKEAAAGLDIYKTTGEYLENLGTPAPGSIGGEWMVVGLLRSDRKVKDIDAYYDAAVKFVQDNIDENGRLHKAKSTENSRMILALTAMGKDVTNVGGHNLLTGLNDMEYVQKQGINGPIWALIALDSGNYPAPEGNVTREALIQVILDAQLADGGWALSGSVSDPDMTGMALQALASYYKTNAEVKKAVDTALIALSDMQAEDGSFASIDGSSSESIAQVITALAALGIDADTDPRFIKNGISAFSALCAFYVEGGGFKHTPDGKLDGMATEQSYYALAAYFRMLDGKIALFNMTDVVDMGGDPVIEEPVETLPTEPETEPVPTDPVETPAKEGRSFPWWLVIVIVVLAGAIVVLVIVSKPKKRR